MTKNIVVGLFALAVVLAPYGGGTAQAVEEVDSISIDSVAADGCGAQDITFTGTATYSEPTQHLVVTLDGDTVYESTSEPEVWSTGVVAVSAGSHTLVATIYDKSNLEEVVAQDSVTFCGSDSDDSSDDGDSGDSGDQGPGGDCCPGPDPVTEEQIEAKVKQVAGATSVSAAELSNRLKPLNSIFRSVYGRTPTFAEWEYWANRLLTDKPQYDALYGAMQWHHMRGLSIGS